jgi:hypothetical protein
MGSGIWEFEHLTNGKRLTVEQDGTIPEKNGAKLIWYNRFTTNARANQQFVVSVNYILKERQQQRKHLVNKTRIWKLSY